MSEVVGSVGGKFPAFKKELRIQQANGLWHQRFHLDTITNRVREVGSD